jgi:predicted AlkP superfamily pyrophosphatase or phosphodiesterase
MPRRWLALGLTALAWIGCAGPTPPGLPAQPRLATPGSVSLPSAGTLASTPAHVVLVSVHGLTPALYSTPQPTMPTLAALAVAGIRAEALIPVFPPTVYPAHATLLTGRTPVHHRVEADRQIGKRGVRTQPYSHASMVEGATLWQRVGEAGGAAASRDWPSTGGANMAFLLPDLGGDGPASDWSKAIAERASPAVTQAAVQAGAASPAAWEHGPEHDAVLGALACDLLTGASPPRLLLLRLSQTEPPLRKGPASSPAARAAFAGADREIARLLGCLAQANLLSSTALVVVGDHGTSPVHTAIRPNALFARVGLLVATNEGAVLSWDALARSNGGSAFVYASGESSAVLARRALVELARSSGAFRVLPADEMIALEGDPEAWFGLEAEPGFVFDDGTLEPVVVPAVPGAVGGYAPEDPAMTTGLVGWGAGLREPLVVPRMKQTDVAPTLARLLGVSLADADGRILVGLLTSGNVELLVKPVEEEEPRGDGS